MSGTKSSGPLRAVRWADASDGAALVRPDGTTLDVSGVPQAVASRQIVNAKRGDLICDFTSSPVGTPSASDVWPEPRYGAPAVPQARGAAGSYAANTNVASQSSAFATIGFWAKGMPRADGEPYSYARIDLGTDNTYANRALCALTIRADGKWRFYVAHSSSFGAAGTFTLGSTTFNCVRFIEQGQASALTASAALSAGATTLTLTAGFGAASGQYITRFSSGECRLASYVNGSAAVSWAPPLTGGATSAIVYTTTRLQAGANDTMQFGPVYRDPSAPAMFLPRFDDGVDVHAVAGVTLSAPFVGVSGVTIPAAVPLSAKSILNAFGFKGSFFILTRLIGQPGYMTAADLQQLQADGHDVCFQTHANPLNGANEGLRLLGPRGYTYIPVGGIASVDTSANTITAATDHKIITIGNAAGGWQGFPVEFVGSNLPAPLQTATQYWLRNTSNTAFAVFATEGDSCLDTNRIDLTSGGTAADFGVRCWGSAPDAAAIGADFGAGRAVMESLGLRGWRYYAPNQGAYDWLIEQEVMRRRSSGEIALTFGLAGSGGVASSNYIPRLANGHPTAGIGYAPSNMFAVSWGEWLNLPVAVQSDGAVSASALRTYVDDLCARGAIGGNYHHGLTDGANLAQLLAVLDQAKLRQDQGLLTVGTCTQAEALLRSFGTLA